MLVPGFYRPISWNITPAVLDLKPYGNVPRRLGVARPCKLDA
jgi:hypothetical protein